jgi:hypothetical protein
MFEINYKYLAVVVFAILILFSLFEPKQKEGFIDPYPIVLWNNIVPKQEWWDLTHRKPFFYNRLGTLQTYRE